MAGVAIKCLFIVFTRPFAFGRTVELAALQVQLLDAQLIIRLIQEAVGIGRIDVRDGKRRREGSQHAPGPVRDGHVDRLLRLCQQA